MKSTIDLNKTISPAVARETDRTRLCPTSNHGEKAISQEVTQFHASLC